MEEMVEVGQVLHLAKSGRLIVKIFQKQNIRAGELLVDPNGRRVGKIIELLGSVNSPYASVIPMTDRTERIIGLTVSTGGLIPKKRDQKIQRKGYAKRLKKRY